MQLTDVELMQALAKRNDKRILAFIVDKYQNLVWKVAYRFTGSSEDSKDILQDTFIRLFEKAHTYTPKASLSTFIYHIVTNICLDFKRKKKSIPESNPDSYEGSHSYQQTDKTVRGDIEKALDTLKKKEKIAIIYKYDLAFSNREIAQIFNTTEKAVERLLSHTRQKLKKKLMDKK